MDGLDSPPPSVPLPIRWTPKRKEALVREYLTTQITAEFITANYGISPEELLNWVKRFKLGGRGALRVNARRVE